MNLLTEDMIRRIQGADFEPPDPKLSPWAIGAIWTGALLFSAGCLYGAGQCLMMAWRALN